MFVVKQTIENNDWLLRRIPNKPDYIKPDNSIASFAFKSRDNDGLSVNIERFTTYAQTVLDRQLFSLCKITTEYIRSISLDAIHDPLDDNYAHALIVGKITNSKASLMAQKFI